MKKIKDYYLPNNEKHFEKFILKNDHYQEAQRNRALSYVKEWDTAIDVGANIGLWAKDLTNFFNKTICFEPNKECLECLNMNINLNKSTIFNCALGSINENKILFTPDDCGGSSFINRTKIGKKPDGTKIHGQFPQATRKQTTQIKKLDDYNFNGINFIKIDVEGFEYQVLQGSILTLERSSPVICIEERDPENSKAIKFLNDLKYKLVDIVVAEYIFIK